MKTEKVNGVNKLTDQQEAMRMQVVDLELKARYWKAQFEIRDYTLKAEMLQKEYEEYLEAQRQKEEKALAEFKAAIEEQEKLANENKVEVQ